MEVGPDALPGPVGPYAVLLLHFFSSHTHKLGGMISSPSCVMISQMCDVRKQIIKEEYIVKK